MEKQHKYIKELHQYKITPPSGTNKRWQTYVKDTQTNSRKQIIAGSEKALLEKLAFYYDVTVHIDNLSFNDIYKEWIEYKASTVSSYNTIVRYNQRYKKYLSTSKLHNMCFKRIDLLTLSAECNRLVKEWKLTNKEWKNLKGIFNGMYDYAFCKGYISENIFVKVTISVKYRQVNKKPSKEVIFTKAERQSLYKFLEEEYNKTHNIVCKAIQFQFLTGLRVGELEALKWDNINENKIHIIDEQVQDRSSYEYSTVPHTKTNQDRFVILIPEAKELLDSLPHISEYVFIKNGKPITTRSYNYILEKYADKSGSVVKSSHDIRRSYASYLHGNCVNPEIIRDQLGHKDLRTTYSYIYSDIEDKEVLSGLEKALK